MSAVPVQAVTLLQISQLAQATLPLDPADELLIDQLSGGVHVTRRVNLFNLPASGIIPGAVALTGVVTPPPIPGGQTDDWAPDLSNISRIDASSSGAATLTGLVGGSEGRLIVITNVGADDITILADNGADSAPESRFAMNGDSILMPGWSAMFIYVSAVQRWSRMGV